jgi:hypothetical protein
MKEEENSIPSCLLCPWTSEVPEKSTTSKMYPFLLPPWEAETTPNGRLIKIRVPFYLSIKKQIKADREKFSDDSEKCIKVFQ